MNISQHVEQFILLVYLSVLGVFNKRAAIKAKRLLLLTTLTCDLANRGYIEKNMIDRIANGLVKHDDTLKLAEDLSANTWSNLPEEKLVIKDDINCLSSTAEMIAQVAPSWVKYDPCLMVMDVVNVIQHCNNDKPQKAVEPVHLPVIRV